MSTSTLIAIIVPAAVVLIALAVGLWMYSRRRHLQEQFGPEYDRAVEDEGGRLAADRELRAREQRHDTLDIKALPAARRAQYADEWRGVQERFVDRPEGSVAQADELVSRLMRERGYPTNGYRKQLQDLSVEHGRTLEHYRAAHDVNVRSSGGQATTEELRGAMVHYRALFEELLSDQGNSDQGGR
ncbi:MULTISPECIES: hypothetical protein [unclassified Streptomyces]|uniref:hypothetical protein n=1 Tax=unclassified Streptomyces TaxID=2593676 RepID=UPI001BE8CFB2|nr:MULTISPECIES: hypothetical protein [unclassified Streptomyces]MBT2408075.1 hypothetical protein [Streptomyces sp. ISL-21]MBT2455776.1 hypothetical protein [Streptomyces sp. ISL-86]MBT2609525.1 hypothetical protein [Streptomyces sp. ISL-87]